MFSYAFMQFFFFPVLGGLSDRFGRRPVLLFSLFGLDYLLLAWAPTIGWLFLGRLIAEVTGASMTTAAAYIADISTPEKRTQNFGMIGAAFGLDFIIGPVIGGLLGVYGSRVPFYAAAGISLINWLYGYFILPESLPKDKRRLFNWKRANPVGSLIQLKKYPVILSLFVSMFFIYMASYATQSTWAYYTMEKFGWDVGRIFSGFCGTDGGDRPGRLDSSGAPQNWQQKRSLYRPHFILHSFRFRIRRLDDVCLYSTLCPQWVRRTFATKHHGWQHPDQTSRANCREPSPA